MKWKTIAILSFAVIALALICAIAGASEDSSADPIGTNVTSAWDSVDHTLTITSTGTATMTDWTSADTTPWCGYAADIQEVVFDGTGTLTNIGNYAFSGCTGLTTIVIPSGVGTIGNNAFSNSGLVSIVLTSSSSTIISNNAFYGCSSLESLAFHGDVVNNEGTIKFYDTSTTPATEITSSSGLGEHTFNLISGETTKYEIAQKATGSAPGRITNAVSPEITFTVPYLGTITVKDTVGSAETTLAPTQYSVGAISNTICTVTIDSGVWVTLGNHMISVDTGYGTATHAIEVVNSTHTVSFEMHNGDTMSAAVINDGENCPRPIPDPTWTGFKFDKWLKGGTEFDFENTPITEDITLDATWTIDKPVLSGFGTAKYSGSSNNMSITSAIPAGATIQWQVCKNSVWTNIDGATDITYGIVNVSDSGNYRAVVTKTYTPSVGTPTTYTGTSEPVTSTVTKREITLTISVADSEYDGTAKLFNLNLETGWNSEEISVAVQLSGSNAGTYTYSSTAQGSGNYYLVGGWSSYTGDINNYEIPPDSGHLVTNDIKINKKAVDLTIPVLTEQYDGQNEREITVDTGISGENLKITATFYSADVGIYFYEAGSTLSEGKYILGNWASGTGDINNYTPSITETPGNQIVSAKAVFLNIDKQIFIYDATNTKVYRESTGVGGDEIEVTVTAYSSDVGTYNYTSNDTLAPGEFKASWQTISPALPSNYNITYGEYPVTVSQRDVLVTAVSQTIVYGDSITPLLVQLSGAVSGHTVYSVTLTESGRNVGVHVLTPSDALIKDGLNHPVTPNYNISYADGTLTVNKKSVTLTIPASSFTYDGVNNTKLLNVTTGVSAETLSVMLTAYRVDAGEYRYNISASPGYYTAGVWMDGTGADGGKVSNYTVTTSNNNGKLTINRASPSILISHPSFEYYNGTDTDVIVPTGVNGETLTLTLRTGSKNVGSYGYSTSTAVDKYKVVDQKDGSGKISNYSLSASSYTGDPLIIERSSISLNVVPTPKYYNGTTSSSPVIVITGIASETLVVTLTASSVNAGSYVYSSMPSAGNYYLLGGWMDGTGGGLVSNYKLNIGSAETFEIMAVSITVAAKPQTLTYGDSISQDVSDVEITSGTMISGDSIFSVTLGQSIENVGVGAITISEVAIHDAYASDVTSNYNVIFVPGVLTINKASIYPVVSKDGSVYDGSNVRKIIVETGIKNEKLQATVTLTSSSAGEYASGDYIISSWDDYSGYVSNYNIQASKGTVVILKKNVTMGIPFTTMTYNGDSLEKVVYVRTYVNEETLKIDVRTYSSNVGLYYYSTEAGAGKYTAGSWQSGTGNISNYNVTVGANEAISIIQAEMKVTVKDQTKIYDGATMSYTLQTSDVTGLVEGDEMTSGAVYTLSADAGSYKVKSVGWDDYDTPLLTKFGIGNYNVTWDVSFTIQQRDISVKSMTASVVEGTFTGAFTCEVIQQIGGLGYVEGEEFEYDFTGSQSVVGSSTNTFTCEDGTADVGNYKITYIYGTLKVMAKENVSVEITITSDIVSEQDQADILASVKYNKGQGTIQTVKITTTMTEVGMGSMFIKEITDDNDTPVIITTSCGKITLTKGMISNSLKDTTSFNVKVALADNETGRYALEYEVLLTADGKEIHELGSPMDVSLFVDLSKVFPVKRTFKIVSVNTGEEYDAAYNDQTGEMSFSAGHLSVFAVTVADNLGGPSFTGVITVIIVSVILAIAAGVLIYFLKKNYYI